MKYSRIFFSAFVFLTILYACNGSSDAPKQSSAAEDSIQAKAMADSLKMCSRQGETIMDPNDPKPMALMMRQMAANADSIKQQVIRGEKLDSLKYPFIRFYLVEPTDKSVLEPEFFENARLFREAYAELFRHPEAQMRYHNLVIGRCISCHENYCSGPLKRIRKLLITSEQL